jgi:hypothetical protein
MSSNEVSRRAFLARIGVLGASAVLLPRCTPGSPPTSEAASELGLGPLVELLRPVLGALARDTLNGFVAFNLPGQDPYSQAQGTPRAEPGGIAAQGTDFLIENLDRFLPFPDALVQPAAASLVTALDDLQLPLSQPLPLPVPLSLPLPLPGGIVTLGLVDDAVRFILQNDDAMPISLPVALLLNYVATVVSPAALSGPFLSPFARLSFAQKARAMELLETSHPQLVAIVDAQLPQPLKASGRRCRRSRCSSATAARAATTPTAAA